MSWAVYWRNRDKQPINDPSDKFCQASRKQLQKPVHNLQVVVDFQVRRCSKRTHWLSWKSPKTCSVLAITKLVMCCFICFRDSRRVSRDIPYAQSGDDEEWRHTHPSCFHPAAQPRSSRQNRILLRRRGTPRARLKWQKAWFQLKIGKQCFISN